MSKRILIKPEKPKEQKHRVLCPKCKKHKGWSLFKNTVRYCIGCKE